LDLCSRLLLDEGDAALIETPHYIGARRAFEVTGAKIVGASVDEQGIDLASLSAAERDQCRLAYVTPSHQFPKGSVMSLARRVALLEWADRANAFLIEDDYDSEFRYAGRSIETLKSLDWSERVVYVGTFSKVLDPALRLAYVVVPKWLKQVFRNAKWMADWASPDFEQKVLAQFIADGGFERHLRRMRTQYGKKRALLLAALSDALGDHARIFDSRAGLHLLVVFHSVPQDRTNRLVGRCLEQGVAVYSAAPYYLSPPKTC
jgi:GntR family transcriptional regulator/MocR family aminotransferase